MIGNRSRREDLVPGIAFSIVEVSKAGVVEDHDGLDDGADPRRGRERARGAEGDGGRFAQGPWAGGGAKPRHWSSQREIRPSEFGPTAPESGGCASIRRVPPKGDEHAARVTSLVEKGTDVVVVLGADTQATAGEGNALSTRCIVPERWSLKPLDMDVKAEGGGHLGGVGGSRPARPLDAMDDSPQSVEVALWMAVGQLDHDPPFGVVVEGGEERGEVTHVVDDVVADDDRCLRGLGGNIWPAANDLGMADPPLLRPLGEHVEHGLALIDGDKDTGRWCEGEAGSPTSSAHIKHPPSRGKHLRGASPRRGRLGVG